MGCFIYAFFGSCKDVNIGPTAIMALMTQPHVEKLGADMAVLLSFLSGLAIFILGFLQLGKLELPLHKIATYTVGVMSIALQITRPVITHYFFM